MVTIQCTSNIWYAIVIRYNELDVICYYKIQIHVCTNYSKATLQI